MGDPFGQPAVGYLGTVTFGSSDPDPGVVLPADYPFQPGDAGQVTFVGGVTLMTPGDQTLTVTDTADDTLTGSAIVTVETTAPRAGLHGRGQPPPGRSQASPTPAQPPPRSAPTPPELRALDEWLALLPAGNEVGLIVPGLRHPSRGEPSWWGADFSSTESQGGAAG